MVVIIVHCSLMLIRRHIISKRELCRVFCLLGEHILDLLCMLVDIIIESVFFLSLGIHLEMLLALRQQQTEQLAFLYPTVRIFNLDKLIKVDMGHRLTLRYPLVFDFLKLTIVQDGRHVEPEVEFGILTGELDPEVTPDFLFSLVQVQNEVLLLLAT